MLLVRTCHKRGAFAMGGMAAQIPIRREPETNERAMAAVKMDKEREVREGSDGSWVAHPDLVPVARGVFEELMSGDNQLGLIPGGAPMTRDDLLAIHTGTRTEQGLRTNIRVGNQYIEAWLRGNGAVPLYKSWKMRRRRRSRVRNFGSGRSMAPRLKTAAPLPTLWSTSFWTMK